MSTAAVIHMAMELWCVVFLMVMLVCTASSFDSKDRFTKSYMELVLFFILTLIADVFAWMFRGVLGVGPGIVVRVANFMYFFAGDLAIYFGGKTLCSFVEKAKPKEESGVNLMNGIAILLGLFLLVGNLFGGYFYVVDIETNLYHRETFHWVHSVLEILPLIFSGIFAVKNRKSLNPIYFKLVWIFVVLWPISMAVQELIYGIQLNNIMATVLIMAMFISTYLVRHDANVKQKQELLDKREEVINLQTANTIAMVSPHFLYNTLNTIYYLCEKNPKTAQKQISSLSDYLRGHMDSLKSTTPIPFEREMEQVQFYLDIEELRYGELVEVDYDIEETDFGVPILTIQLLVENAIKHGLHPKKEGGNILISTRKEDGFYVVSVKDDGIGFDPNIKKEDGRSHTGIYSIRERLRSISNGTLEIKSEIGKGTESIIRIPVSR